MYKNLAFIKNKLFNRNYILVIASATLFYTSAFMVNSTCARYCVQLGLGKVLAGIVSAFFTFVSFFLRPVRSFFTDRYGRKAAVYTGGTSCAFGAALLIFAKSLPLLLVSRRLFGIGYSAYTTGCGTLVCDVSKKENMSNALAIYGVTNVLSQALAPAVGLLLAGVDYSFVGMAASGLCIVSFAVVFFIRYKEKDYLDRKARFRIYSEKALKVVITAALFAMTVSSVNSFIPVMADERGIPAPWLFFGFSSSGLLILRFFYGRIQSRFGYRVVFFGGAVSMGAGFMSVAFARGLILLSLGGALYGVGSGAVHPTLNTLRVKDVSDSERGLATGTFMMSQDIGMTAGAVVWGFVSEKAGFYTVYFLCAALCRAMAAVFYMFFRKAGVLKPLKHR